MTTRVLPWDEWAKLDGFECAVLRPFVTEATGRFVVVEDEGQIVGACCLFLEAQCDGFEVVPARRFEGVVVRALLEALAVEAQQIGSGLVVSTPKHDSVRRVIERAGGQPLPTRYLWSVPKAIDALYERT